MKKKQKIIFESLLFIIFVCIVIIMIFLIKNNNFKNYNNDKKQNMNNKNEQNVSKYDENEDINQTLNIKINDKVYSAILYDVKSAQELKEYMPCTLDMKELNGNEKYYMFNRNFTVNNQIVDNINAGDIMIYDNKYLVVFYKNIENTDCKYTKVGRIMNSKVLEENIGNKDISMSFSIKSNNNIRLN